MKLTWNYRWCIEHFQWIIHSEMSGMWNCFSIDRKMALYCEENYLINCFMRKIGIFILLSIACKYQIILFLCIKSERFFKNHVKITIFFTKSRCTYIIAFCSSHLIIFPNELKSRNLKLFQSRTWFLIFCNKCLSTEDLLFYFILIVIECTDLHILPNLSNVVV